jgi:hypothetical protein
MAKNKIESFEVKEVQIAPDGREADVTVLVTFYIPQISAPFHQPRKTKWINERRNWHIKLPPVVSATELFQKVFGGASMGGLSAPQPVQAPLRFDQNPVRLSPQQGAAEVTAQVPFQNTTASVVSVTQLGSNCPCLQVSMDKVLLQPGEQGILTVTYRALPTGPPPRPPVVQATIGPSFYLLDLPVEITGP